MTAIRKPVMGERVQTPSGEGTVEAVLDWKEATYGMGDGERRKLKETVESFLGNAEKDYFEYVVKDGSGELAVYDWSEYHTNFQ